MKKIVDRIKNILSVIEIAFRGIEDNPTEMLKIMDGKWYRRETTELHALIFALNSIDENLEIFLTYSPIEVHNLPILK